LWDIENLTCSQCGQGYVDHADAEKVWYPQRTVDYAAMELAAAHARYAAVHEDRPFHDGSFKSWAAKRSSSHPYKYDEGVSIFLAETDVQPWDEFLTREDADPQEPEATQ
jgi:hypothetical protein